MARRIDLDRQEVIGRPVVVLRFRRGDTLSSLAWLPNGRSLALAGRMGGIEGAWLVARRGGAPRLVLCGCDQRLGMPDGRITEVAPGFGGRLAVVAESDQVERVALYRAQADGAYLRPLAELPTSETLADPAWAPDGQRLVFERRAWAPVEPSKP